MLAKARLLLCPELQRHGVPPDDRVGALFRQVRAGHDPVLCFTTGGPLQNGIVTKRRTPFGRFWLPRILRVEGRVHHVDPAGDAFIADNGDDEEITRARRRYVREANRFGLVVASTSSRRSSSSRGMHPASRVAWSPCTWSM